jgi:hypothetical protein
MPGKGDEQRVKGLGELLAECNSSTNQIYSELKIQSISDEKKHKKTLENNLDFLASKFNGLNELDNDSAKKVINFFLRLGEEVYTEELLRRKDGNYILSHHLFIHNYLNNKGSFNDLETRITVLAHDFLEDIIDKSEKLKRYGTTDQDKIKIRDMGLDFLEGYLKEMDFNPKESKKVKGEVQALSRVRSQHYFDYLDSMLIFSLVQSEFESSDEEEVDFSIRKETKREEYKNDGIRGLIKEYFKHNEPDGKAYKLLEIKMADRIHNTLTLPEKTFSYKRRLFEVAKSMYMVHLGKMMVQAGFQKLCNEHLDNFKEIKEFSDYDEEKDKFCEPIRKYFKSFHHLSKYLRDKEGSFEDEELNSSLNLLYRVSDEVTDLAAVCISQTSNLENSLEDRFGKSKKDVVDTEIKSAMKYDLLGDIYKKAASFEDDNKKRSYLANALDTLFSWYAPPKKGNNNSKKDVEPLKGYTIAKFLNKLINKNILDNSYFLENLNHIEGRELWYHKHSKSLFPKKMVERSEKQKKF